MNLTQSQQQAVAARGNVLVVAGAGTGKTKTLVERCVDCMRRERPRVSLEEILMVTFTEAAAAEMRHRIRISLEAEAQADPANPHWQEQLALFETARIGTLHSFCLQVVRQHFYELELDPQVSVLPEEEARLLAQETLDELFEAHYAGRTPNARAVQELIQAQGRGRDEAIRALLLRFYRYMRSLPNPAAWLDGQAGVFSEDAPTEWEQWLLTGVLEWRADSMGLLANAPTENKVAAECLAALSQALPESRPGIAGVLGQVIGARDNCPKGHKGKWLKPLKHFFAEAEFLLSLAEFKNQPDPLVQDWGWIRPQLQTVLELVREFDRAFTEAKRQLGRVDFADLEQYSLRLLWDHERNQPSGTALEWRKRLRFVFVDEYQDINAAQDRIIEAIGGDVQHANRFLVGDVKQSIYRFRLANPRIFQRYAEAWRGPAGQVIPLSENFRSREAVLAFINSFFRHAMRPESGGIAYDDEAALRFGAPEARKGLSMQANQARCAELLLRLKRGNKTREDEDDDDAENGDDEALAAIREMEEAGKEARMAALRLVKLKEAQHKIWDEDIKDFRAVEWGDMAVLLRSPSNKAEVYAKEFSRLGVPLQVARGGFYRSMEISDLLSLLQLLDNPLQDLPCLAVLHSPLVGLSLEELGNIRLTVKVHFWTALKRWQESKSRGQPSAGPTAGEEETLAKVNRFLEQYSRWRRLARQVSLSACLDTVLAETQYGTWVLTQPRGEQRHANVQRFLRLATQFDQFQRQSLFRFLRFIEAQQAAETEPEVGAVTGDDCARLMSIHQSKGLEFPVVLVADLGKGFNLADLRADLIFDEEYGVCPQIKPPDTGSRYPSLPFWLARRRQLRELHGEELRLLYVAMTRARDLLLLTATITEKQFNERWQGTAASPGVARGKPVSSYSDWLGDWFAANFASTPKGATSGENAVLQWRILEDSELTDSRLPASPELAAAQFLESDAAVWQKLQARLGWEYAFPAGILQPAKTSVTALRRQADDADAETVPFFTFQKGQSEPGGQPQRSEVSNAAADEDVRAPITGGSPRRGKLTAAERGTAHHRFMSLISLDRAGTLEGLHEEAARLEREQALTRAESKELDLAGIAAFWNSRVGREALAHPEAVRRELEFTARFSPNDLAQLIGRPEHPYLEQEFVVVQGVADLVLILPDQIHIVDFKTDALKGNEAGEKSAIYAPQLRLYSRALSSIYKRPVTSCWLYFLRLRRLVSIEDEVAAAT